MKIVFRKYLLQPFEAKSYGVVLYDIKKQPTLDFLWGLNVYAIILIKKKH